jgi:hypothetical protein
MLKVRFVVALILLILVSTSAFAIGGIRYWYYSDSSFTTSVGARYIPDRDCPEDDYWWAWGTTSAYRKVFEFSECYEWPEDNVYCQVYNNGWTTVPCP